MRSLRIARRELRRELPEAATEVICFLMSEAHDQALNAKRKSVSGQDFINACGHLGACSLVTN